MPSLPSSVHPSCGSVASRDHVAAGAGAGPRWATRGAPHALKTLACCLVLCAGGQLAAQCELDKLLPGGLLAEDQAGAAVSMYGMDLLIGRPMADVPGVGADVGIVATYSRLDPGWVELAPFVAPASAAGDRFGAALALISELAVIGAPGADPSVQDGGVAYVYERVGDVWSLVARLVPPGLTAGAAFGSSVSAYGETLVIGAPGADASTQAGAGAAYVYEKRTGLWVLVRRLESPAPRAGGAFGCSVSTEGPVIVVGARGDDGLPSVGPGAGAAYVFERYPEIWGFKSALYAANGASGDGFGSAVSNWGAFAAVGSPGHDAGGTDAGSATMFQKLGSGWPAVKSFHATVPAAGAAFGSCVSLFKDLLAVAAPGGSASGSAAGEVQMFQKVPGNWVPGPTLYASDAVVHDNYGSCVSVWDDSLLVGAPGVDDVGSSAGAAYVVQPYGVTTWVDLVIGGSGAPGAMHLSGSGELCGGDSMKLTLKDASPGAPVALIAGVAQVDLPFHGGLLVPRPDFVVAGLVTDAAGGMVLQSSVPSGVPTALQLFVQAWVAEGVGPGALVGSNAVLGLTP